MDLDEIKGEKISRIEIKQLEIAICNAMKEKNQSSIGLKLLSLGQILKTTEHIPNPRRANPSVTFLHSFNLSMSDSQNEILARALGRPAMVGFIVLLATYLSTGQLIPGWV